MTFSWVEMDGRGPIPGQVALWCTRNKVEWATESKSVSNDPPHSLLQLLPPGPHLNFPQWWTMTWKLKPKTNKQKCFHPPNSFWWVFYLSKRNQTRTLLPVHKEERERVMEEHVKDQFQASTYMSKLVCMPHLRTHGGTHLWTYIHTEAPQHAHEKKINIQYHSSSEKHNLKHNECHLYWLECLMLKNKWKLSADEDMEK